MLSYTISSGALGSPGLLLSYLTTKLVLHETIILIITHFSNPKSINQQAWKPLSNWQRNMAPTRPSLDLPPLKESSSSTCGELTPSPCPLNGTGRASAHVSLTSNEYFSILVVSYCTLSGVLERSALHLSHPPYRPSY